MFSGMNLRNPVLINTVGHTAGLLLFGVILALLIRDRRANSVRQTKLSIAAAALALAWNVGSLVALASNDASTVSVTVMMTVSFSVLSFLPAVLLQLELKGQQKAISCIGYVLSSCAVCLHISEFLTPSRVPHQVALILIAVGFSGLTSAAFLLWWRNRPTKPKESAEWFSLACLLLFVCSFPHFGYKHFGSPWAAEIAWHHLGIPVALVVLLRDYRFLLLDTFIRFLMNSVLAGGYLTGVLFLNQRFQLLRQLESSLFLTGLALVAFCLSLTVFAHTRDALQRWIGRVIFRRRNVDETLRNIVQLSAEAQSEDDLLLSAAREVAAHLRTDQFALAADPDAAADPDRPAVLFGSQRIQQLPREMSWAEAQIPLRFSSGEMRFLLTGPRAGRQRYLSEDLEDMRRLGSALVEQVERFRSEELKRLATQAELRALQAQINPHFLFNALNTLYGSIDRGSFNARRMVLNLAEIFRYFLQGNRSFIPLSEELRIVEAYLEIESLRLGDRLETELRVSEFARSALIPILSIQPLTPRGRSNFRIFRSTTIT
jgi:two-component system, LytTR family, sensor kinase